MEMEIVTYKTGIQIDILVDFGDMGGWGLEEENEMNYPCNVEACSATKTIVCIYPQIHLYMGNIY